MFRGRLAPLILCVAVILLATRFLGCGKKADEGPVMDEGPRMTIAPQPDAPGEPSESEEASAPTQPVPEPSVAPDEEKPESAEPAEKPEPAPQPEPPKPTEKDKPAPTKAKPPEPKPEPTTPAKPEPTKPPKPVASLVPTVPPEVPPEPAPEEKPEGTVVIGTVTVASSVPDPSTVPYKECTTYVKYKVESVESGDYDGDELLAVLWGMKDRKLQPAASFSAGQKHRLVIEPFSNHPKLARLQMADDTNEYSLTPYWVKSYSSQ